MAILAVPLSFPSLPEKSLTMSHLYGKHYPESNTNIHISWQNIINSCNQLDLWSWFLGFRVDVGQPICNPMRVDTHANCYLSWGFTKDKFIVLNDFAVRVPFHGFTVFDALMYSYGLTFDEACEKVYEEFMIPGEIQLRDASSEYQTKRQDDFNFILNYIPWTLNGREIYTKHDKDFWSQFEITKANLIEDNVKSNRRIIFNSRNKPNQLTALDVIPSYTYLFGDHKKCYQPYADSKLKWKSTCTEEDIGGWDQVEASNLIITKSYKDWRVLKNSGYNTIWLQNEGCKIPFDKLIKLQSIPTKFILFDNDTPGQIAAQNLAGYCNQFDNSYIPLWFDENMPKDSADVVKQYSSQVLEQELANLGIQ